MGERREQSSWRYVGRAQHGWRHKSTVLQARGPAREALATVPRSGCISNWARQNGHEPKTRDGIMGKRVKEAALRCTQGSGSSTRIVLLLAFASVKSVIEVGLPAFGCPDWSSDGNASMETGRAPLFHVKLPSNQVLCFPPSQRPAPRP